ncbi:MAG: SURF1 family protein [Alphaproteobacteria bacterium]
MWRKLAIPFFMTLSGVTVLIGLGVWQLERREWKLGLIEQLNARIHAEPVSLARMNELWQEQANGDAEYTRVHLSGRFLHSEERYLYAAKNGKQGWDVITPLISASGEVVLVNRGFVPENRRDPVTRKAGLLAGTVELKGLVRASERKTWFTPDNDPAANRWFWSDIPGLIASLKRKEAARAVPFLVEAEAGPLIPGGWPKGGVTRLNLPNNHLEYALTWFSLAVAFAVIFILFARNRLREPPSSARSNVVEMIKRNAEYDNRSRLMR